MKIKRFTALLLVFVLWLTSGGFSFFVKDVAVDTEDMKLYKYVTFDTIAGDFGYNRTTAEAKYKNNYWMVVGYVSSISKKGDKLTLRAMNSSETIDCTCSDSTVRSAITGYSINSKVALYGELTMGFFDKEYHISIEQITLAPTSVRGGDSYYLKDGTCYSIMDSYERTLAGGRIKYYIPSYFEQVEVNIREHELGTLEGYQYVLNRLPGSKSSDPESLFVCYFSKDKLDVQSDIKRPEAVEKAIVWNIEGNESIRSVTKKVNTYYDRDYTYFQGKYTNSIDSKGYRTEYIFQEDGEKGLIMFLYLYRETDRRKTHISDVMFVTRFMGQQ